MKPPVVDISVSTIDSEAAEEDLDAGFGELQELGTSHLHSW